VDSGGGKMEHERLGVGGVLNVSGVSSVGLGCKNEGHKARLEVAGNVASRS